MPHVLASTAEVFMVTLSSPFLVASGLTLLPAPTAAAREPGRASV